MNAAGYRQLYTEKMELYNLPITTRESLLEYIMTGRPVGGFLLAVLENDLKAAVARGDRDSQDGLVFIVQFLDRFAPAGCWGCPNVTRQWLGLESFDEEAVQDKQVR